MHSLISLLDRLEHLRVLVLGDIMLDRYIIGAADRVSPEAAVIVLRAEADEVRLGGAASVAALLRGLAVSVDLMGVVGNDPPAGTIRQLGKDAGIDTTRVFTDLDRPTTTKERILGSAWQRPGQQMLRIDHESREPLSETLSRQLSSAITKRLSQVDVVLVSDYGKGTCCPELLTQIFSAAENANVPVLVDPARGASLNAYQGATILKANRVEAEQVCGRRIISPEDGRIAAAEIQAEYGFPSVVITLDQDGCVLAEKGESKAFPTEPHAVCDVTGAGDLFLAMLGIGVGSGISPSEMLPLANVAAGLEVGRLGVSLVTRDELRSAISGPHRVSQSKVITAEVAGSLVAQYRQLGKRIVFTNGCFDLFHAGHVSCLQEAAAQGDVLFVAVNSDASVKRIKGESRPIYSEQERIALLAAMGCVDHVILLDADTPHRLLHLLRPDVLAKGGTTLEVVCRDMVEAWGGRVVITGAIKGLSTTDTVNRIHASACAVP